MDAVTEKCACPSQSGRFSAMDVCMGLTAILSLLLLLFAAVQAQAQTMTVLHNFDLLADGGYRRYGGLDDRRSVSEGGNAG